MIAKGRIKTVEATHEPSESYFDYDYANFGWVYIHPARLLIKAITENGDKVLISVITGLDNTTSRTKEEMAGEFFKRKLVGKKIEFLSRKRSEEDGNTHPPFPARIEMSYQEIKDSMRELIRERRKAIK